MSFSTALYYPWIDIRDEGWLKNAALFWDQIRTIVPESIREPYSSETALALADAGALAPLRVRSDMEEIKALVPDIVRFLESSEGAELLLSGRRGLPTYVHLQKLPEDLQRLTRIHPEKLPYEIHHIIRDITDRPGREGEWMEVDNAFADFYMTLLATRLAERTGAGLLTPMAASHRLSIAAKADSPLSGFIRRASLYEMEFDAWGPRRGMPATLAQGMLVDLIIEELGVDPETPLKKVLKFREDHAAELGRFREEIASLTSSIEGELPAESLRQSVADVYGNRVKPALDELKAALRGSRIKYLAGGFMKVAFLSAGSSSALVGAGLSVPQALLVGAGLSMTAATILYSVDKKESLTNNPYSYVLKVGRTL